MKQNQTRAQSGPIFLIALGGLLLLSLGIWLIFSSAKNTSADSPSQPNALVPTSPFIADIPDPDMKRVSLVDAKKALDDQSAVFVDVRDAGSYAKAHVSGSINIPLADIETRLADFPKNRWIITYCT